LTASLTERTEASERDAALAQFWRRPVIQTADHAQLLVDPVSFFTNLVFGLGALQVGCRYLFVNACSTVTLETRAGSGPGWLSVDGALYEMRRTSVCAAENGARFVLESRSPPPRPLANRVRAIEELAEQIGAAEYPSFQHALVSANEALWRAWDWQRRTTLIYTDDRLTAAVVARHLSDAGSPLRRILFEPRLRRGWAEGLIRRRIGAGSLALRGSTDYFWGLRAGKVRPLRLRGEWLVEPGHAGGFRIRFGEEELRTGLDCGSLFPDLAVGFLALSVLPEVTVLGGWSQSIYLPIIERVFADIAPLLESPNRTLPSARSRFGYIAGVIEANEHPAVLLSNLLGGSELPHLWKQWENRRLSESMGTLRLFEPLVEWNNALAPAV
jgi:hypothetical protein